MADISKIKVPIDGVMTEFNIKGSGGGGGSGLPDEVITYDQFEQKTDQEQITYTGYVTGWPGAKETVRYDERSDYLQVLYNGTWSNAIYIGKKLDPTKLTLTQDEFVAICNQGLQSSMTIGAIITLNNDRCSEYEVIDVNHDSTVGTVDIMAHTQVGSIAFGTSYNYNGSSVRNWINGIYLNKFDKVVRNLMKPMTVVTGGVTQQDKAKLLSWKEIGFINTTGCDVTDGGELYPVFTEAAASTAVANRARSAGSYGTNYYWLRSNFTSSASYPQWVINVLSYKGANDAYGSIQGILPIMRF